MAHGKEAARDLRYGRRGGRWADNTEHAPAEPCAACGDPMTVGQPVMHMQCCVNAGTHRYGGCDTCLMPRPGGNR